MVNKRQRVRKAVLIISMILFPITLNYFSPYLIVVGAAQGIVVGSLVTFGALFISSLFLGRLFCGWLCPAGALQEMAFLANDKKVNGKRLDWIKYLLIWSPWVTTIVFLLIWSGGIRKFDPLYLTETGISVSEPANYIIYLAVVGAFLVISLIGGRRAGCHAVCWIAPFMVLGRKTRNLFGWRSLTLTAEPEKCVNCGICTSVCTMSLDVQKMVAERKMEHSECILCGQCIDSCPKNVISYSYSRSKRDQ
jgi:polyferredoxin